jgi:hypothetical protein
VLESKMLMKMFGPKRDEVTRQVRIFYEKFGVIFTCYLAVIIMSVICDLEQEEKKYVLKSGHMEN